MSRRLQRDPSPKALPDSPRTRKPQVLEAENKAPQSSGIPRPVRARARSAPGAGDLGPRRRFWLDASPKETPGARVEQQTPNRPLCEWRNRQCMQPEMAQPVPEAHLQLSYAGQPLEPELSRDLRTLSAPDGTFSLGELPEGEARLVVSAPGYVSRTSDVTIVTGTVQPLELSLKQGLFLEGRVLSPRGEPLPGATVHTGTSSTTTDSAGQFRFVGLKPGRVRLTAWHSQGRIERDIRVESPGAEVDLALAEGHVVAGHVVDRTGDAIAYASVQLGNSHLAGPSIRGFTDVDGSFELEGVLPGRYELVADKEGSAGPWHILASTALATAEGTVEISTRSPESLLDLELRRGANLVLRASLDGTPAAGALVRLANSETGTLASSSVGSVCSRPQENSTSMTASRHGIPLLSQQSSVLVAGLLFFICINGVIAGTQAETPMKRPLLHGTNMGSTVLGRGQKIVFAAQSPSKGFGVLFVDNALVAYLYALDFARPERPIVDSLLVYTNGDPTVDQKPVLRVLWSPDGTAAALLLDDYPEAVFDFEGQHGYCRKGFPAPQGDWKAHPHSWDDAALLSFR